jgi:hypothetical protein
MAINGINEEPVSDQTATRNSRGQFVKGNKPKNGFDKNPQNIANGGYWRYKKHGKSAIMGIFKMTVAEFEGHKEIDDTEKTVLDVILFEKFKSAMNGNPKNAEYLLGQVFDYDPVDLWV